LIAAAAVLGFGGVIAGTIAAAEIGVSGVGLLATGIVLAVEAVILVISGRALRKVSKDSRKYQSAWNITFVFLILAVIRAGNSFMSGGLQALRANGGTIFWHLLILLLISSVKKQNA
ncbi:MAG: hypothetical protein IKE68_01420, partial [Solobacterium sp.]|nr:hypothetical protein [Solobacterium sp.]